MNLEQLKLVLETFNAAGEGGKELFLWWLAKGFVGDVFEFLILGTLVVAVYKVGKTALDDYIFTGKIADVMGDSTPMYSGTKKNVLDILEKHMNK